MQLFYHYLHFLNIEYIIFNLLSNLFQQGQGLNNDVYKKGKLLLESDYRNGIAKEKEIVRLMDPSAKEFDVQNPEKWPKMG